MPPKAYPPREFPNLPSFEESLDLWTAQLDKTYPGLRVATPAAALFFLVGLLGSVVGPSLTMRAVAFGAMMLGGAVLLVWGHALATLGPRPTQEHWTKSRDLMRAYGAIKDLDSPRASD